ncbi:Molybdenum cofactor biosysynthesis protein [Hyella patelloides LEGE 07179]|uniref:Molybdenum cofactor biosysynthesis protein n=1 Tax=Hyella patelloides LEGE 07179 TaxID=945734 RepID=A0A563VQL9_9CYAN|nr:MOSC N-terminal beta barrel domain-containing protein [Hyella patelloides]VEP13723.1 Molybdenum cofactor biosysynthesis protein [Hyella patelloides LEGE 07179]
MSDLVPYVSRLFIYPIKSLDRVEVETATILKSGALKRDREFAIFDRSGKFVNGKRNHKVHAIRSQFDLKTNIVALRLQETEQISKFHIEQERDALEHWLNKYFGFPVNIKQNLETGFPDDVVSPGATIISTATLEAIASWYPKLEVEEVRLRFRSNIEISGVPAFWEDRLFSTAEETVNFQIGNVHFMGVNPCQRCVVITRDSQTGEAYPHFQKTFITKRQETLPDWTERSQFNHFYRLAINTRLSSTEEGKTISLGNQIRVHKV